MNNNKILSLLCLFVFVVSTAGCCRNPFYNRVHQCGEMIPVKYSKYGTNTSFWDDDCVGEWKAAPPGPWYVCDCTNKLKLDSFDKNVQQMQNEKIPWCEER